MSNYGEPQQRERDLALAYFIECCNTLDYLLDKGRLKNLYIKYGYEDAFGEIESVNHLKNEIRELNEKYNLNTNSVFLSELYREIVLADFEFLLDINQE